jgi:hypothetical protein
MSQKHSPNDDRSNVKNPNNPQYQADRESRLRQGHDNVPPASPDAPRAPQPAPSQGPGGGGSRSGR